MRVSVVVDVFLRINDDHERAAGRNNNKIRMGHFIARSADHLYFVRLKRHRPSEVANCSNDHKHFIAPVLQSVNFGLFLTLI